MRASVAGKNEAHSIIAAHRILISINAKGKGLQAHRPSLDDDSKWSVVPSSFVEESPKYFGVIWHNRPCVISEVIVNHEFVRPYESGELSLNLNKMTVIVGADARGKQAHGVSFP